MKQNQLHAKYLRFRIRTFFLFYSKTFLFHFLKLNPRIAMPFYTKNIKIMIQKWFLPFTSIIIMLFFVFFFKNRNFLFLSLKEFKLKQKLFHSHAKWHRQQKSSSSHFYAIIIYWISLPTFPSYLWYLFYYLLFRGFKDNFHKSRNSIVVKILNWNFLSWWQWKP